MSTYTIVKKNNSGIVFGDVSFGIDRLPYITKNEKFLNGEFIINRRVEKLSKDDVLNTSHIVEKLVNNMSIYSENRFFDRIINMEDSSELDEDINRFIMIHPKRYEINSKLYTSIFIKSIIRLHYKRIIDSYSCWEFNTIMDNRITGMDYKELMLTLLPNEKIDTHCGDLLVKAFISAIDDRFYERDHLCWGPCAYSDPVNCLKVRDNWNHKKTIDKYPFITEGFQVYKDGHLDRFIVTGCSQHKLSKKKK